ncbi:MAG: GNAT family N-acetyltransferase [Myxococcales bacterium]|nr:GNAT family N-acetyltransferase [Myxococcales bacterium]
MFSFDIRPFDALTLRELYDILALRDRVFVVGQKITDEPEVDGLDPRAWHAQVLDENGLLVATLRVFLDEVPAVVGRVATEPTRQGQGIGSWMMTQCQAWLGDRPATMHAQAHLEGWYGRLGWHAYGEPYLECGIPHVSMCRPAPSKSQAESP